MPSTNASSANCTPPPTVFAILDKLEAEVSRTSTRWDGAARDAYEYAQGRWSGAMTTMNGILDQADAAAVVAGEALRGAETAARGLWS
ncbi:WXG100 family type VII secretion target [Microbacterium sp. P07]|uniref:WXG100 family type VII secretion target n=1 Tax=Microbacterium sp. P07 TaxID=3366952 RepID=UPI003746FEDA